MAEKVELEVVITPTGEVQITVKGVKGKSCEDLSRQIEAELGEVLERKRTPEYYQAQENIRKQRKTT